MATEWRFKAEYIKNCNCAPGCPCDFWAIPTYYKCEGMMAFHILEGNLGLRNSAALSPAEHTIGPVRCISATARSSRMCPTTRAPNSAKLY